MSEKLRMAKASMRPSVDLTRSGDCACCGAPVSLHFDGGNRSVGCAVARQRFGGQALELDPQEAQPFDRRNHVGLRPHQSIFELRIGIFG